MPFQPGNKCGRGGPRPGAGRKPKRLDALTSAVDGGDARGEDVTRYLSEIDRIASDPLTPVEVKLQALIYLLDRALGKPSQTIDLTGNVAVRVVREGGEGDANGAMEAVTSTSDFEPWAIGATAALATAAAEG